MRSRNKTAALCKSFERRMRKSIRRASDGLNTVRWVSPHYKAAAAPIHGNTALNHSTLGNQPDPRKHRTASGNLTKASKGYPISVGILELFTPMME